MNRSSKRFSRWRVLVALGAVAVAVAVAVATRTTAPPPNPVTNRAFLSTGNEDRPTTVWAVGDGADGGETAKAVAARISSSQSDRLLYLGDVYESGTASDFRDRFASVYRALAPRIAPTPGNHDWPKHDSGYDPYWRGVTGAATPPWYRFRAGRWDIISLNSEAPHGAKSAQVRWLQRQVRAPGTCRLAFWHRPRFSAGSHGDQPDVSPLWDALRHRVSLVVNGHDHNLQRMRPVDGITELIAGAGGRGHYDLDPDYPRLAFADDRAYGALRISLHAQEADLAFVRTDGAVIDRSSVRCSPLDQRS